MHAVQHQGLATFSGELLVRSQPRKEPSTGPVDTFGQHAWIAILLDLDDKTVDIPGSKIDSCDWPYLHIHGKFSSDLEPND